MQTSKTFFFDVARGVSAQMVLIGHALNVCFPSYFMREGRGNLLEARPDLFYIQNLGVLVFFCLSGYLVTTSVMRRSRDGGYALKDYLLDRVARIFTPLLPLLAILFVVDNVLAQEGLILRYTQLNSDPLTLLLNATMLFDHVGMSALSRLTGIDWLKAGAFGTADQLWTVVIEWWIYVSFGILAFAVIKRRRPSALLWVLLLCALTVPTYLLLRGNGLIVAWIVGMLGALGSARLSSLPKAVLCAAGVFLAVVAAAQAWSTGFAFYHPLFAASFSLCLLVAQRLAAQFKSPSPVGGLSRLVTGLSEISYSVYLVHLSVVFWIVAWKPTYTESSSMLVILVLTANAIAVIFYFCFERHYPSVRRKLAACLSGRPAAERVST